MLERLTAEKRSKQLVLLSENDIKEALSFAFLSLVASRAGFTCARPMDHDRDSVDAHIRSGGSMRPALDVQLKSTSNPRFSRGRLCHSLKRKNYDDLRIVRTIPIILIVFELPPDKAEWLVGDEESHILKKRAWWISLRDAPAIEQSSKTVHIPKGNLVTVSNLENMMRTLSSRRRL